MRGALSAGALLCLTAMLLSGCGGGGGGESSTAASATTSASTAPKVAKPKPSARPAKLPSGPAPTDPDPLPNQGSKAPAPGVPTTKGGDNSIQTYGTESESTERIQAARVAEAYLSARAQGRWAEACTYLAASIRERLKALAVHLKKGPQDCAAMMAALGEGVPRSTLAQAAQIHVLSFRVEGEHGFLVYRDGAGKPFNIPMAPEGGRWMVAGLIGSELLV